MTVENKHVEKKVEKKMTIKIVNIASVDT